MVKEKGKVNTEIRYASNWKICSTKYTLNFQFVLYDFREKTITAY